MNPIHVSCPLNCGSPLFDVETFCNMKTYFLPVLFLIFSIMVLPGLLVQVLWSSPKVVFLAGFLGENQANFLP